MENINKYKDLLLSEKEKLEEELSKIAIKEKDGDDWVIAFEGKGDIADSNEKADVIENMEERISTFSELEARLANVLLALRNMEKGEYGICQICQKNIEEDRLTANPASKTCKTHINEKID